MGSCEETKQEKFVKALSTLSLLDKIILIDQRIEVDATAAALQQYLITLSVATVRETARNGRQGPAMGRRAEADDQGAGSDQRTRVVGWEVAAMPRAADRHISRFARPRRQSGWLRQPSHTPFPGGRS